MDRELIPRFILRKYDASEYHGQIDAATLFLDVSGFTPLTAALMAGGASGAEALSSILGGIFAPMVDAVYENAGFVSVFAGDAFTAIFPASGVAGGAEVAGGHAGEPATRFDVAGKPVTASGAVESSGPVGRARAAAKVCRAVVDREHLQRTDVGEFAIEARIGIGYGTVEWGIVGTLPDDDPAAARLSYYFRGDALQQAYSAEARAKSGSVGLSDAARGAATAPDAPEADAPEADAPEAAVPPKGENVSGAEAASAVETQGLFRPMADIPLQRSGEFRSIVSLFVAVDPGERYDEINTTAGCVLRSAEAYGGYFDVLDFGDKGCVMLILFGAPRSRGRERERAAGCAREILASLGARARIGLADGTVFAGLLGSPQRATYTALGQTVNLAARLALEADPHSALATDSLASQLSSKFVFSAPVSKVLKGISEPVRVCSLDTGDAAVSRQDVVHPVGRDLQLERIDGWIETRSGHSGLRFFVVSGAAGVGKSLLLESALENAGPTIRLATEPILGKSLNLFFELVPEVCRIAGEPRPTQETLDSCRRALIAKAAGLDGKVGRALSGVSDALPALMGLPGGPEYQEREARARFEMIADAAIALVRLAVLCGCHTALFEDMHASDTDSRTLLERISRNVNDQPVDFVLVRRDGTEEAAYEPVLPSGVPVEQLDVPPLEPEALSELATRVLNAPVAPALSDFLYRRVGGNPFYAIEMVRFLRSSERLRHGPDGFEVSGADSDIPHSVTAVVVERLDTLPAHVRELAAYAAVIGIEFHSDVIESVYRNSGSDVTALAEALSTGVSSGLWSEIGDGRYRFSQVLVRDALVSMQLEAERSKMHGAVYDVLSRMYADDSAHQPELAHHAEEAGRVAEALTALWRSFEYAKSNFKNEAAESFLRRYLGLCSNPADTMRVHVELGALSELTGDWNASGESLIHALGLAVMNRAESMQIDILTSLARVYSRQGRGREAVSVGSQAVERAESAQLDTELCAALTAVGRALWTAGKLDEADEKLARAAEIGARLDDAMNEGLALYYRGVVLRDRSDYRGALELFNRAERRLDQHGDAQLTSFPLYDIGVLMQYEGDLEKSVDAFEHVLEVYRKTGYRSGESAAILNLGVLRDRRGDFEGAIEYFERALEIAGHIGEQLAIAYTKFSIGATYYKMFENRKALAYLRDALRVMKQLGAKGYYGYVLSYLAALYARSGNVDQVVSMCSYHLAVMRDVGSDPENGLALLSLARVLTTGRHVSEKHRSALSDFADYYGVDIKDPGTLFKRAIKTAEAAGYVNTLIPARYHYARFLKAGGRGSEAGEQFREAYKLARAASWDRFVGKMEKDYSTVLDRETVAR